MKVFRGRKDAEPDAAASVVDADGADEVSSWTGGPSLATRMFTVCLMAAVACGPLALLRGPARAGQAAPSLPVQVVAQHESPDQAAASAAGLEVVQTWLSSTSVDHERLDALMGSSQNLGTVPAGVVDLQVVAAVETDSPGVWSVTVSGMAPVGGLDYDSVVQPTGGVAAPVAQSASPELTTATSASASAQPAAGTDEKADASGKGVRVRVAWRVPMRVSQVDGVTSTQALAWPCPVVLSQQKEAEIDGYEESMSLTGSAADVVSSFVKAYVTGGDLSRLVSPQVSMRPLPAGVYTGAELVELSANEWETEWDKTPPEDKQVVVLAEVRLSTVSQAQSPSSWSMSLTARAGRWEVSSLQPAPMTEGGASASPAPMTEGGASASPAPMTEGGASASPAPTN